MLSYQKYLEKCNRVASIYLHHLLQYKSQIPRDVSLSPQAKEKMKVLLEQFCGRIEDFLNTLDLEKACLQGEELHREIVAEEFVKITNYLERLLATTPQLQGIKVKVDAEIKKGEKITKPILEKARSKKTINEQWLESVAKEFGEQRKKKIMHGGLSKSSISKKEYPGKILAPEDVTNYLEGFKKMQEEFVALKEDLRRLKEEPHEHKVIETQLRSIEKASLKIVTNNKLVQQEQSELLLQLRALSEKIRGLESENEDLVKRLKRVMSGVEDNYPYYGKSEMVPKSASKLSFPLPQSFGLTPASKM